MGNIWAAETMLGIEVDADSLLSADKNSIFKSIEKNIRSKSWRSSRHAKRWPIPSGLMHDDIQYYTTLFDGDKLYISAEYQSPTIIDKVGSGDCFMAGLIYGFYNEMKPQDTLEFATAAAFTKLFIQGDATNI